ncbi:MAG: hypothetical protein IPM29_18775 [Planctomycetes bacterium]|nr:hypothetical protein [Planctomycetota bacterium]
MNLPKQHVLVVLLASGLALGAAAQEQPKPATESSATSPGGNSWFSTTELDFGRHLEGEVATGRFDFHNPHDQAHQFRGFQPSCTCSKAVVHLGDVSYSIENNPQPNTIFRTTKNADGSTARERVDVVPIGAGESGYVEVQVDLRGVVGPKEATITIMTSDATLPTIVLKGKAVAMQFFRLVPPEVNLNRMSWKEERHFSVQITSPMQPDFEITGHGTLPDRMQIQMAKEEKDGAAIWTIEGVYGPNVDPSAGGGIVELFTNVEGRKIPLRVMAWVEGPLEVRPSTFIPFGRIRQGEGASKTVEFEATDDFDLQIESVEFRNLSVEESLVTAVTSKDGKVCKLEIRISPEVSRRLVRGDVIVRLNHPAAEVKELQFNGYVR